MNYPELTQNFAATPKDGNWYKLPLIAEDLTEFIRWDKLLGHWDWMMLKDDIAVLEVSHIQEAEE